MQSLSEDEQRLFRLYGKLPNKKDLLQNKFKVSTRTTPSHISVPTIRVKVASRLTFRGTVTRNASTSTPATTLSRKLAKPQTSALPPSVLSTLCRRISRTSLPPARTQTVPTATDIPETDSRAHKVGVR